MPYVSRLVRKKNPRGMRYSIATQSALTRALEHSGISKGGGIPKGGGRIALYYNARHQLIGRRELSYHRPSSVQKLPWGTEH